MNFQNLIDYYQWQGIDVFEGCTVPSPFNIDMVINEIMKRCGLLTPIYNDPSVFKNLTKMWFDSNQWNFEHLAKVYEADYSPIENVYEVDHWTEGNSGTDSRSITGDDITSESGNNDMIYVSDITSSGDDKITHGLSTNHNVSAYNSGGYQSDSQDVNSGTDKTEYGKTETHSGKDTEEFGKKTTLTHGSKDDFTHGHRVDYDRLRHGNIGVTTNNKLISEELQMLKEFNPYDWIAAKFERENFLQIY